MKLRLLVCGFLLAGLTTGVWAQQSGASSEAGRTSIPTNSPEPLTLLALAGGAAVAGGAAYRKRRQSRS